MYSLAIFGLYHSSKDCNLLLNLIKTVYITVGSDERSKPKSTTTTLSRDLTGFLFELIAHVSHLYCRLLF